LQFSWTSRQCWTLFVIIIGEDVWWFLWKFRYCDEAGEVTQIRAFIVELDEAVVLLIISFTKWYEEAIVTERWRLVSQLLMVG